MSFHLREYQQECITFTDLALGKHERVANVLPTGSGKTVIFGHYLWRYLAGKPARKALVLVHTDELTQQAYDKIRVINPGVTVGIVKAAQNDVDAQIIVASRQTLQSKARRDQITGITLIIIDECHHVQVSNTYWSVIQHYPGAKVVGFTATLGRSDDGDLSKIWETVAYRRDILWMIRNEFLIDVRGLHVKVDDLDLKKVKKSGGDYQEADLGKALSDAMAPEVVAKSWLEHAQGRQTICFAPLVASAYEFADAFNDAGVKAEVVHGALPKPERRAILRRYADGVTQVLCNAMVLTEGFDDPKTSCIIVARPTKSKPLFQQMVGRGLRVDLERPWPDQDCLVMVVAGAEMHDLRSIVDLTEKDIAPKPGQSLIEAEDEQEAGDGTAERKPQWRGATKVKEFDPLMRASRRTWDHTDGGSRFLPAGDFYIVLMESKETLGAWDVAWFSKAGQRKQGRTEYTGLPLDLAMDWGEDVADRMGGDRSILNTKGKAWRRSKDLSPAQVKFARSLGIEVVEGTTRKGELSEAIEHVIASRRIDPVIAQYQKHLEEQGS